MSAFSSLWSLWFSGLLIIAASRYEHDTNVRAVPSKPTSADTASLVKAETRIIMDIFGGWSEKKPANGEIQGICSVMKSNVESITNTSYRKFRAIIHRVQIVAGTYHLVRVYTGEEKMIDLMVLEPLPQRTPEGFRTSEFQLTGIKQNQKLEDPLEPFN